ncbi:MAG: pyridoxine 5'-phosphate synthase [Myxococcota bacterium]
MTTLSVNVNKVAWLRNSRPGDNPSVVEFAELALSAGAHGITIHPRPDERHIRATDVDALAELLASSAWADREFNLEGNPFEGRYMEHCRRVRPHQCTLVPDTAQQLTSDHGWDLDQNYGALQSVVSELSDLGCRVSLFVDPEPERLERVTETGAHRVELYTESYARAFASGSFEKSLADFRSTAKRAQALGLGVNAGHDLDLFNLPTFLQIPGILEVSIGHALTADALRVGYPAAVIAYLRAIQEAALK